MTPPSFNANVISPRFLEKLRSGVIIDSDTPAEVLVTFADDASLQKFLDDQARAGTASPYEVKRVARSIRTVTLRTRLGAVATMSNRAADLKVTNIDENFPVHAVIGAKGDKATGKIASPQPAPPAAQGTGQKPAALVTHPLPVLPAHPTDLATASVAVGPVGALNLNTNVISPRFLEMLRSGISIDSDTPAEVLVTFADDASLQQFVNQQTQAGNASPYAIIRVARSIHTVALRARLGAVGTLSNQSADLKVTNIDENFKVRVSLDQTRALELTDGAWGNGYHGEGIRVAVLDTGIDPNHPDLKDAVSARQNFSTEDAADHVGHGTHVSGIIAGRGVQDPTKRGLAYAAMLLDGKVLGSDGQGSAGDVIAGIEWAVANGADIINMSLGAAGPFDGTDPLSKSADWAVGQGVVVCAAAGNCGPTGNQLSCPARGDKTIQTPGCAATVITVGAVDKSKVIAGYSSRGPTWGNVDKPDVLTVGSNIVSARAQGTALGTPVNDFYTSASGTSMATPVCSALVALYLQATRQAGQHPAPADVKQHLRDTATPLPGLRTADQGAGFVDAARLLAGVGGAPPQQPAGDPLEVVNFATTDGTSQKAGETRAWVLTLHNKSAGQLYELAATVAPGDLDLQPRSRDIGNLAAGDTTTLPYSIRATAAGTFIVTVAFSYKLTPDGTAQEWVAQGPIPIGAADATGTALRVVDLTPQGGSPPAAGEVRNWLLTLENPSGAKVYGVTAGLTAAGVTAQPSSASFGDLDTGARAKMAFALQGASAGPVTLDVTLGYQATAGGAAVQQRAQVSITLAPATTAPVPPRRIDAARVLRDATQTLLAQQQADGHWAGSIMFNAWSNGMYAIAHKVMGLDGTPDGVLDWLEAHRSGLADNGSPDQTWGIVDDASPHFLEAAIASEIALEIWGRGRRQEVWDFINRQGELRLANALSLVDPYTQAFASLASDFRPSGTDPYYAISDILAPPVELILSPRVVRASVPRMFAAWGQDAIPALMIIVTLGSSAGSPPLLKQILLANAEAKLLRSQNEDGSWYCTVLPTLAATMGLFVLGYKLTNPVMQRAVAFLKSLQRPDGYVSRFHLPVWDTGLSVLALRSAGIAADHPALQQAGAFLMASQEQVSGGAPFQRENRNYPDVDDASIFLWALDQINMGARQPEKQQALRRGLRWVLYMQGDDGGFSAFTKNQATKVLGRIPYFKDDPPTADVTGHALAVMYQARKLGLDEQAGRAIAAAEQWLQKDQMSRGEWFGRWGLTFTYGTTAVLQGLTGAGLSLTSDYAQRGVGYLLSSQHQDGGWGEGYATYYDWQAREDVPSMIDQTSWALLGLMTVPQTDRIRSALDRGVNFLVQNYDPSTGYGRAGYTVGALWIYRNTLYPLMWATWALGQYVQTRGGA